MSAVEDTNKANQKFYNMKITSMGYAPEPMFLLGEKMYESMSSNERAVNHGPTVAADAKTDDDKAEY